MLGVNILSSSHNSESRSRTTLPAGALRRGATRAARRNPAPLPRARSPSLGWRWKQPSGVRLILSLSRCRSRGFDVHPSSPAASTAATADLDTLDAIDWHDCTCRLGPGDSEPPGDSARVKLNMPISLAIQRQHADQQWNSPPGRTKCRERCGHYQNDDRDGCRHTSPFTAKRITAGHDSNSGRL